MQRMPEGRPPSEPHSKKIIVVGVVQGLLLTTLIFLIIV